MTDESLAPPLVSRLHARGGRFRKFAVGIHRPRPHPVFQAFAALRDRQRSVRRDYVGAWSRPEFHGEPGIAGLTAGSAPASGSMPAVDEEYFEWVDLLSAVIEARDRFAMLELGAGFGRWGVRGARAARLAGVPKVLIGFAEAEPTHCRWLRQHAADNGLAEDEALFWDCAVSDVAGEILFYTQMPDGSANNTPGQWYGQAIAREVVVEEGSAATDKASLRFESGYGGVRVPVRPLAELLEGLGRVDLIDMDVQGEELRVVQGSIEAMNRQVERVHIGTHNAEVEEGLRDVLVRHGWRKVFDFASGTTQLTAFGEVRFDDGVQSWVNPRVAAAA